MVSADGEGPISAAISDPSRQRWLGKPSSPACIETGDWKLWRHERGGPPKRNEALCGTRLRASASSGELLVLLGQQDGNDSEAGLALV